MTIIIALIIFAVGVAGGAWPILLGDKPDARRWLIDGEAFARGIFLSAAIIHMLPDAEANLVEAVGKVNYPYTFMIAIVTVWLLCLLRQTALRICQHTSSQIHRHLMNLREYCDQMDCDSIAAVLNSAVSGFSNHEIRYDHVWKKQGKVGQALIAGPPKLAAASNVQELFPE